MKAESRVVVPYVATVEEKPKQPSETPKATPAATATAIVVPGVAPVEKKPTSAPVTPTSTASATDASPNP